MPYVLYCLFVSIKPWVFGDNRRDDRAIGNDHDKDDDDDDDDVVVL